MATERELIITWIRQNGHGREHWLLDLLRHLTDNDVPFDAAIEALECFVNEVIAVKERASLVH